LSFVGPKIALKIFLSKTPKTASSDFDNTRVSGPYAFSFVQSLIITTEQTNAEFLS
jgi:hypothetical protein